MNVYEIVTEKVIELLEKGCVPWRKPWASKDAAKPRNLVSRKPYRGINTFLLMATSYASPYWLTYKQATELGGHVREGEKSTMIVFWKVSPRKASDDDGAQDGESNTRDLRNRFILRYYRVFNVEQCELPQAVLDKLPKPEATEVNDTQPIAACETIVANMPKRPAFNHGGDRAFYRPAADAITLPAREQFAIAEEYYSTAFHEMTHSTGHVTRLGRDGIMGTIEFGSSDYSKEELVAEMGAAFLCAEAGIVTATIDNSAAYIQSWLKKLRDDHKLVVIAAAQAQKAADFILDRQSDCGE